MDNRLYWFWLLTIDDITPSIVEKLLIKYGNVENIFRYSDCGDFTELQYELISSSRKNFGSVERAFDGLEGNGIKFILRDDTDYPERLCGIPEEPYGFFLQGKLPEPEKVAVAIIGARRCTQHGRWVAEKLGEDLSRYGINIVSGMAEGIDGSGQLGALNGGGYTLAVLGSGIDVCYPRSHQWLFDRLKSEGGIISEYGPGTPGVAYHFPSRNRIISALSDVVILVEAKEKSGSLITINRALSQGREVMAVPGRPDDPCSISCNKLLKEGAGCCTCAGDVLDYLQVSPAFKRTPAYFQAENNLFHAKKQKKGGTGCNLSGLTVQESLVLSVLSGEPKHIDYISKETGIAPSSVNGILIKLQIKGFINGITNGLYQKN